MNSTYLNDGVSYHHPHTHQTQATVTLAIDATALHELSFKLWDVSGVWTDGWMDAGRDGMEVDSERQEGEGRECDGMGWRDAVTQIQTQEVDSYCGWP